MPYRLVTIWTMVSCHNITINHMIYGYTINGPHGSANQRVLIYSTKCETAFRSLFMI